MVSVSGASAKAELGNNAVKVVQGGMDGGNIAPKPKAEKCENDHSWTKSYVRWLYLFLMLHNF